MLYVGPALAAAQPLRPPSDAQVQDIYAAASERALGLGVVTPSGSRLFFREAGGRFDLGFPIDSRVAFIAVPDRDLLVFFDDEQFYRYDVDTEQLKPARNLPRGQQPVALVGDRNLVYAIIPALPEPEAPAAALAAPPGRPPALDTGGAAYGLAAYDGRNWEAATPLPSAVGPASNRRLEPRLCLAHDTLLLFAVSERSNQIHCFYHDAENKRWIPRGVAGVPRLTGFWAVNFNRVATLVAAAPDPDGGERIRAYQPPGHPGEADLGAWKPADDLELSALPRAVTVARYAAAFGFNQHLGLLALDTGGQAYLQFGRVGSAPAEQTEKVADLLAQPGAALRTRGLLQMFTFVVLLGLLAGLFVFRRGSLVNRVELPAGYTLAFHLQRLLASAIDFGPFTLAAAIMLDIPWSGGLATLAKWGISPDPEGSLPEQRVLTWWTLSVCGCTAYMLVMELVAGRTIGKLLARVYLVSESGRRAGAGQILVRNLMRLIELMPQFWVFIVLVLLSRNRQRIGDIFARTIVVRRTATELAATDAGPRSPEGDTEGKSESDQPDEGADDDQPGASSP